MKNMVKLFGIIALVALIGFSMVSCEDEGGPGGGYYGGGGGGSSGGLAGTYRLSSNSSIWITFYSNLNYTGFDGGSSKSSTYTFDGYYIYLYSYYIDGVDEFYYYTSYLTDENGRRWNRQ